MQTNNQRFADAVFPHVQSAAKSDNAGKYKTLCKKTGSLVRNSGLMQALAFMQAKGVKENEKHHETLLNHLREELRSLNCIPQDNTTKSTHDFAAFVRKTEVPDYMVLTRQILLLLNWHKRLADTFITKEDE